MDPNPKLSVKETESRGQTVVAAPLQVQSVPQQLESVDAEVMKPLSANMPSIITPAKLPLPHPTNEELDSEPEDSSESDGDKSGSSRRSFKSVSMSGSSSKSKSNSAKSSSKSESTNVTRGEKNLSPDAVESKSMDDVVFPDGPEPVVLPQAPEKMCRKRVANLMVAALVHMENRRSIRVEPRVLDQWRDLSSRIDSLAQWVDKRLTFNDILLMGNGFRSFILLAEELSKKVLYEHTPDRDHSLGEFIAVVNHVLTIVMGLITHYEYHLLKSGKTELESIHVEITPALHAAMVAKLREDEFISRLSFLYADSTNCYWLSTSMRKVAGTISRLITMFSPGLSIGQRMRCVMDGERRGKLLAKILHKEPNIEFFKWLWNITEKKCIRAVTRGSIRIPFTRRIPAVHLDLQVPRQREWHIEVEGNVSKVVRKTDEIPHLNGHVRCRHLNNRLQADNPNSVANSSNFVILEAHGGGFIAQSPDSHQRYLNSWACDIPGVPFILVDYSLSPEAVYPTAVQQVLDVYLWLVSGSPDVEKELGIKPENIIVFGDSAGATIIMQMLMALDEVRQIALNHKSETKVPPLPHSCISAYPAYQLNNYASPSRVFGGMDMILPIGIMMELPGAYIGKDGMAVQLARSPLVSPPEGRKEIFTRLAPIRLFQYACHFDALLDDAICIQVKWQGEKELKLYSGLSHGFLNFFAFSKEAKYASKEIMNKIRALVGYPLLNIEQFAPEVPNQDQLQHTPSASSVHPPMIASKK